MQHSNRLKLKIMKSYNLFGSLLIMSLLLTGITACRKALDKVPYDQVDEANAFVTEQDFTNALRGMYNRMIMTGTTRATFGPNNYLGGEDAFSWASSPDILADNLVIASLGRRSQQAMYQWTYSANTTTNTWQDAYQVIRLANAILENLENIQDSELDFKSNVEGEALAVRGMAHFDLLRLYAKPLSGAHAASASDPGVPYVTSTDADAMPGRSTARQTYAHVVADLEEAEGLIGEDNGPGRLNKAAVSGLLSRVYLYGGEWQKAKNAADRSLAANGDVGSINMFPAIWTDETESGVLFKAIITTIDDIAIGVGYNQPGPSGIRNEYVADYEFYESFGDDDIRKSTYFETNEFQGFPYNSIVKYQGKPGGVASVNDMKYLRVAEVLLNRAEAQYRLGQEAAALADLNMLRSNRYTSFTAGTESGAQLLDAILSERRKELAYEGHRFFDLKRLGLPVQRSNNGDRADGTGPVPQSQYRTLSAGDYRFQLPIPQYEINTNRNIIQNPGY
jgi:hypothetical protein